MLGKQHQDTLENDMLIQFYLTLIHFYLLYYPTNATLVCVLSDIKSDAIVCLFLSGDKHFGEVPPISVKYCSMVV